MSSTTTTGNAHGHGSGDTSSTSSDDSLGLNINPKCEDQECVVKNLRGKIEALAGAVNIIVLGASGDLAKKKIYPILWKLYSDELLKKGTKIVGYARSVMSHAEFADKLKPFIKPSAEEAAKYDAFVKSLIYINGAYDVSADFERLDKELCSFEGKEGNRIFYLALPPTVFKPVTENIKLACMSKTGWTRVIVEKPFGKDLASSNDLAQHLAKLFSEEQIYRIDHYLGKEMVQNLLILRFANMMFSPLWNRNHIQSVQISFKEDFGTQGRGGYFDEFGIIRDVMQNHLLQILCLVGMEKPPTTSADDIRHEKVKLLKSIPPIELKDVVLGQYTASSHPKNDEQKKGYLEDETVPKGSKCATFATAILNIKNERWDGVPFVMRCGKALNERKAEIRIQFKDVPGNIFDGIVRNELVIRVQPNEAVYLKFMNKRPGMGFDVVQTDLDLSYNSRYKGVRLPDAYERLMIDVVLGNQLNFVRSDELAEAWRIFTPLLHEIESKGVSPVLYEFGSRGPRESDELIDKLGYKYTSYPWTSKN